MNIYISFFKFQHITQEILQKEILGFSFGVLSIATGLILGLNVERCSKNNQEDDQMKNLINAIKFEAKFNDSILNIYERYADNDSANIKSEFNFSIANEASKSELWMKKASQNQMTKLSTYLSFLNKVNEFKKEDSNYKALIYQTSKPVYAKKYRKEFKDAFKIVLKSCKKSINSVESKNF